MITDRIHQAALDRRRTDGQMRVNLASKADAVWTVLETCLAEIPISSLGLVSDTEKMRTYPAERSLAVVEWEPDAARLNREEGQ